MAVVERVACPGCRAKGLDSSGDNLVIYDDGGGYCHSCGYTKTRKGSKKRKQETEVEDKVKVVNDIDVKLIQKSYPIREIEVRGISREACKEFGVRVGVDESSGEVNRVYFPYYTPDGELQTYKARHPTDKSHGSIYWLANAEKSGIFGQQLHQGKKRKLLILTEGEFDCLAVYDMLISQGKKYPVCSIKAGASTSGKVDKSIVENLEFFAQFETVVLFFDNDIPGMAYAKTVADFLISVCNIKIIQAPKPNKDANDMLLAGLEDDLINLIASAKDYHPEMVVKGSDISVEYLMEADEPGYELPWPEIQNKLKGLRKGEITIVAAGPGLGKTTYVKEMEYHLLSQGATFANMYLETRMKDVARSFIAIDNNVPLARLMFNPQCISEEAYKKSHRDLIASNKMYFFNHWGSVDSNVLQNKLKYFAKSLQVDFIVIDNLTMAIAGNESDNERKDIDKLMENLTKLCDETGVGIVLVVHLKRVNGKNFNKGDEVEITDLRGSGSLEALSSNIIGLERDQQDEENKNLLKSRVLKNRLFGFTGVCDTMIYSSETGRITTFNREF